MAKIYALAMVNISELRDSKLAVLFDEAEDVFSGKWEHLWTSNNRLTREISFKCKTYKTLNGAQRSAALLTKNRSGKGVRLERAYYDERRNWISNFTFDTSIYKLVPTDITDIWNKTIDDMILKEKTSYEYKINRLQLKKV